MRQSARDQNRIDASSGNLSTIPGFDDAEARALALRADLMAQVEKTIAARKLTRIAAAKLPGVTRGRVSALKRGKVEKSSLDRRVSFAARLGKPAGIRPAAGWNTASSQQGREAGHPAGLAWLFSGARGRAWLPGLRHGATRVARHGPDDFGAS